MQGPSPDWQGQDYGTHTWVWGTPTDSSNQPPASNPPPPAPPPVPTPDVWGGGGRPPWAGQGNDQGDNGQGGGRPPWAGIPRWQRPADWQNPASYAPGWTPAPKPARGLLGLDDQGDQGGNDQGDQGGNDQGQNPNPLGGGVPGQNDQSGWDRWSTFRGLPAYANLPDSVKSTLRTLLGI